MAIWVHGLFFLSGFLVVLGVVFAVSTPPSFVETRLAQLTGRVAPKTKRPAASDVTRSALRRIVRAFPFEVSKLLRRGKSNPQVHRRLTAAGFHGPEAAQSLFGWQWILGLGLFVPYLVLALARDVPPGQAFLVSLLVAGIGFLLPKLWLGRRARRRRDAIHRALPDFLDLLIICMEAGQGIDQALVRVSRELRGSNPVFAEELHILNLESKAGKPRAEALRNLYERTRVEDLKSFSAMLINAERYGVSITNSLRIFSDTLRTSRRQAAEEEAAKTVIKISFPLVLFIFPALMILVLGPAALQFFKGVLGQ
ncbi:MAG: type II secretion system F family protein [Nitrospinota bacterium]